MPVIRLTERQWARYHDGLAGEVTRRLAARREALILDHMPMAERIARKVLSMFVRAGSGGYAAGLDAEDFVSAGRVGLVQAADRYRSEDGSFQRFAYLRIRGAVIDAHKRQAYREELHDSIDRWAEADTENASADYKGWMQAKIERYLNDRGPLPDELTAKNERAALLRRAIDLLPDDERAIILRALRGELAGAIAASYGHSPNWARTRLNAAREKLAARLKEAA